MRPLAYGNDVMERRARGERVGLLVVAVHDWDAGQWYAGRPEVCRVVLPSDLPIEAADWTIALAADVLVCGRCDERLFYAVCSALARAGAASVWGDFDDGFWSLEPLRKSWVALEGPYPVQRFGAALRRHRDAMILLRRGMYGSRVYDAARAALAAPILEVCA